MDHGSYWHAPALTASIFGPPCFQLRSSPAQPVWGLRRCCTACFIKSGDILRPPFAITSALFTQLKKKNPIYPRNEKGAPRLRNTSQNLAHATTSFFWALFLALIRYVKYVLHPPPSSKPSKSVSLPDTNSTATLRHQGLNQLGVVQRSFLFSTASRPRRFFKKQNKKKFCSGDDLNEKPGRRHLTS